MQVLARQQPGLVQGPGLTCCGMAGPAMSCCHSCVAAWWGCRICRPFMFGMLLLRLLCCSDTKSLCS